MKRIFLLAVGLGILGIALFTQVTKAQVYSEFESVTLTNHTYIELERPTPLDFRQFGLPPTFEPDNYRNGYYKEPINLPFEFKYGDHTYTQIWVNVNGFAMFLRPGELPPFVAPDEQIGLFRASASYPKNVLAPYWGDHYYRSVLDEPFNYLVSQISYQNINNEQFVIQWKDLNINFDDDPSDQVTTPIKSSVGNFQLHLFKSENYPDNKQGRIEFAYGVVGGNPDTVSGNRVITRGAAVGIKGESNDYLNGLFYNQPHYLSYTSEDFTIKWPPSGGTDWRITFVPKKTVSMDSTWGDGDADLSQAPGNLHGGLPQSRFVTANDVRMILHAVATDTPLDSAYGRNAYHADVNHNGRYYFPFVDTTLRREDGITEFDTTVIYRTDIVGKDD